MTDEITDEPYDLAPADAADDDAAETADTMMLDRLDADEDFGAPEPAHDPPPLSRREIDQLVDRILGQELKRLSGSGPRKKA